MKFRTEISIPKAPWQITYQDKTALLGSCFSDNIAEKMKQYYFQVICNPTGTLYNPVSIARHLEDEYVCDADVVIITFGTAWVYVDKATNLVVDNCQKRPSSDFIRRRLSVDEIVDLWQPLVAKHADKRFIFTVSPIRHLKDGLHENNLSKGILLLAVEQLNAYYFPSYEIVLDDLRDYRFYSDDLMHPNQAAINYIWEQFTATFMSESTQREMKELNALWLNRHHRSLYPDSIADKEFKARTDEQFRTLKERYPWLS